MRSNIVFHLLAEKQFFLCKRVFKTYLYSYHLQTIQYISSRYLSLSRWLFFISFPCVYLECILDWGISRSLLYRFISFLFSSRGRLFHFFLFLFFPFYFQNYAFLISSSPLTLAYFYRGKKRKSFFLSFCIHEDVCACGTWYTQVCSSLFLFENRIISLSSWKNQAADRISSGQT
jgi:hypothetical protein